MPNQQCQGTECGLQLAFTTTTSTTTTTTTTTTTLHPFHGLFSRTAWVSQHQKGKPFWILLEQQMVASAGPYANHLHLSSDR